MPYTPGGYPYNGATLPGNQGASDSISLDEWNEFLANLSNLGNSVVAGDYFGMRDMVGGMPDAAPTGQARIACRNGRLEISENGNSWRRLTGEDGVYDIRDYGAVPGPTGKAATTAAFEAIFAENTYSYFPTVNGERNATIFIPFTRNTGWYVDELTGYVGSPGASLNFIGEAASGYTGLEGSVLYYDGAAGGTLLDLQAINRSLIRNITFYGNRKASKLLHVRQYWNEANASQVGSNGVQVLDCMFIEPENEYDSILVAAGKDDDPPNTLQTSELRFVRCYFQGVDLGAGLTKQGWGFKTLNAGNTKNFVFQNCIFVQVHRGIECSSGYLFVEEVSGANIGYDRADSALIYGSGNTWTILGGGMENSNPGYVAQFLNAGQGTSVHMAGVYIACTPPADDFVIDLGGPTSIVGCDIGGNSRTAASTIDWTALTAVLVGQERQNDSKIYTCITAGTTAGAGGPTGTGSDITDGTAHWEYSNTLTGNVLKIRAGAQEASGWGGVAINHCTFPCTTTAVTGVPIYDGSGNALWASLAKDNSDFAKSVSHKISARGCSTGLYGYSISTQLPDFHGADQIITRDQLWTDSSTTGITIRRNANGVFVVTVPYTVVAAGATVALCQLPMKTVVTDCILDVTTAFAGSGGLASITAVTGLTTIDPDGFLTSGAIDSTGQRGVDPTHRGALLTTGRYVSSWAVNTDTFAIVVSAGAGSLANLTAGSLTLYLRTKRLGV